MKCVPLRPIGSEVTELSLRTVDSGTVAALKELLAHHGVLILPRQHLDDAAFVRLLALIGKPAFTQGEMPVAGFPDLNVVSNVGRTVAPRSTFHVDTSYLRRPPAYTALNAVTIPSRGGETLFTNQYVAYETLDLELRQRLDGRTVTHVATGVELGPEDESVADHPLFLRHPISRRTSLYISTPKRCRAISGMAAAEAERMVQALYAHSTKTANILRHQWSPGEVVMWDNRCVLHRADHSAVTGERVLHRGLVAG